MSKSHRSSIASPNCRLEWRPSRWVIGGLLALTALGVFSILVSEMPRPVAWPLAASALGYGLWLTRLESRKPTLSFVWPGSDGPAMLDGDPIREVEVQWRGSLAFVRWRVKTGRIQRVSWWPDTLSPASRRELRLATPVAIASRQRGAMAP
ncbi:MAG: hypothetical protein LH470_03830 [Lysobacter sp.]|nr:hypothetical protein [Lysobacter sp.]